MENSAGNWILIILMILTWVVGIIVALYMLCIANDDIKPVARAQGSSDRLNQEGGSLDNNLAQPLVKKENMDSINNEPESKSDNSGNQAEGGKKEVQEMSEMKEEWELIW